tara:strand:- start:2370 stop:2729 length:360 start_codon:yes stop_codon:yes gene_type:complete
MADSFLVSSEFAEELQTTVSKVQAMTSDGGSAKKLPVDHTEGISVPKSSQHVASFSGAWAKGTSKSVTILSYSSGSWTATSATVSAHNLFFEITSTSGKCFVAKESSSSKYILVAAECD